MLEKLRPRWANACAPLVSLLQELNITPEPDGPKLTTTITKLANQPEEEKFGESSEEEPHMTKVEEDIAHLVIQLSGPAKVPGQGGKEDPPKASAEFPRPWGRT